MCESGIDMEWCDCENAIEWLDGQKTATVTIHSEKLRNRVLKLAEKHPDRVRIVAHPKENQGYLYARIPRAWIKISPPRKLDLTEEQKKFYSENGKRTIEENRRRKKTDA